MFSSWPGSRSIACSTGRSGGRRVTELSLISIVIKLNLTSYHHLLMECKVSNDVKCTSIYDICYISIDVNLMLHKCVKITLFDINLISNDVWPTLKHDVILMTKWDVITTSKGHQMLL